jgi:acyl-CoA reductase-like NAD-dependent aldehyde dehydrogenase
MTSATTTPGPTPPQPAAKPSSDPLAEIRRVYELQKANRWRMARTTAHERIAKLRKLRDRIGETRQQLEQAIWDDFHKPPAETDVTEVSPTLDEVDFAMKNLHKWMKPIHVNTPVALFGTRSKVKLEQIEHLVHPPYTTKVKERVQAAIKYLLK